MRLQPLLMALSLTTALVFSQQKLSLDNLYDGTFRAEGLQQIHAQKDGDHFTVLNYDRETKSSSLVQYAYATFEKTSTLFDSSQWPEVASVSSYAFSEDEQKILIETAVIPIFRHSKKAKYFVFDRSANTLISVSEARIQEPLFSPDAKKLAFVKDRNLFVLDLQTQQTRQLTFDGNDHISNGLTDWVYEEEFAFVRAFDWNASGTHLAFIRFDESEVPHFSMDVIGQELYPSQMRFRYPKAGEKNADVSVHLAELSTRKVSKISVEIPEYVARIQFTPKSEILSLQTLNRHQNQLNLIHYNMNTQQAELVLQETDPAYVDVHDNLTYMADNSFIWTSERDGYNHLYYYNAHGQLIQQLTQGAWEVTAYYGFDPRTKTVYYQSTENGSIFRDVYAVNLQGKKKRQLSVGLGSHSADFSADFSYYINTYSKDGIPPQYTLHKTKNAHLLKTLEDNDQLSATIKKYGLQQKQFSTLEVFDETLNIWMLKPADFDPNKTYPLLMFQYSGPGSQQVADSYYGSNNLWHQYLVQQGYIVACVDGRGTGFKGAAFKKSTYLNLVKYETEDQIEAARILGKLPYIDAQRIGIWGWSFGGHMATNCILKGNDVFSTAIAVAPVTSWRFYDTIYTERFMRTPQENPSGYDDNSPFNYPELLKGNFLIVHGSGDDNVHVQNTMRMVEGLIQANKQFEWMIYPDKNHGIYGGNTRLHLFTKMTNFIQENL